MHATPPPFEETPIPLSSSRNYSPLKLLATIAILTFVAEAIAMIVLYYLRIPNYVTNSLLDEVVMLVLIFPGLYFFQFRQILKKMEEQARVEIGLRTSETNIRRIYVLMDRFFNSIHTMIAYLDKDFNFIRVNQTYAESAGHPIDYFPGKNHFALYPHAENEAIFRSVLETGQPYLVFEKPFENSEFPERGVTYWDWSLQPVIGTDSKVEGLVLSLVDVTRRKQAEMQLERQNQELRQLTETEHRQRVLAETMRASAQALSQTLDLEHVINTLLDHIHRIVKCDTSGLTLMEGEDRWTMRASQGYNAWAGQAEIPSAPLDKINDITSIQMLHTVLILPNNGSGADLENGSGPGQIQSWAVLPIIASDKVIGFVELGNALKEPFHPEQIQWAETLVLGASVAIQNAWLFEQVRSSSIRLQSLARKLVELQEKERYYIARELHDEAGQVLSSLKLSLGQLEQEPDCPPPIRQGLLDLKGAADCLLEDLHRLAMDLRPVALDHLGLVAALEQLANQINAEGLSVKFKALGMGGERLPHDMETSLYRIVQEALTNVVQHAHASSVGILLERSGGKMKLFVEDDGIGFTPDQVDSGERLGLVGMRERAEMFGGSLSIESSPGSGTSIIVEVPDDNPYLDHR